ncbi:Tensin [Fasciola gigantica]|uniref:Tensin n=1 Tax=Fasciola gigantica TaxID=46835 RepID=A0A504YS77_FASGI|nr:Tensin [Fasciola gigantica]
MAPAKMLHLRGGSVSPSSRPYDTSVIKVGGEVFDKDGYRMDVTVWFRHRNEVLYYLDSGGSVHGPMDQKHTTRLGNISRSGQVIPGSKYYLSDGSSQSRTMRRQSESGAWDMKSEMRSYQTTDSFRGRTYSESRRPFESSSQRPYYRTTASHTVSATSPPSHHISRWSSMQSTGTQGLWRGGSSSASRYATTLTRQHIKRHREPVEMLVKHPPSLGASKVDLVSIDNRRSSSPQLHYVTTVEREMSSDREKRLQDELINTRRELQELKRSHSLTGDQHLLSSSKYNVKSTSTQYLNDGTWTTHTLKKNEGMPCGARVSSFQRAMMPSNPGTIPEPVESEKLFRKKTLSNGSKTTSQTEESVLENSRQQKAEEKRDYFHYQTNNATEEQINHIQDEHGTNSLKSSIALSSSKLKLRSRELPHLLGPTNQDLFSSAQVNQQHEIMDHQNHRLEELTEEMNSFHSEFRPLTHHHTRKLPLPRQTLTNPDLTDFIPDKSKSTSASNAAMMNESQARRVEHHTVERLQSNVNSAIPLEDIVDTVMPLEGNQARLKLFDAPPWMKRSTHTGVSPTGRRTPGAHSNAGTSSSMGIRGTTAAERHHASRASTSASGLATFNFRQVEMAPHTKPHSKRLSASEPPKVSLIRENEITSNRNMSSSPSPRRTTGEGLPKYPVQIVRTTKHDDDQLIEIIRERGAESKTSISSKLKPHRSLGSLNVRPRIRSATPGESYSHHQETNHIIAVNSPKYDEMTAPPPSSTYWRQQAFSESGGSPMLERGEYRSSLRNARVIRPIHSTPASPVMGHSANRTGMSASTMVRSHMWNGETRAAALPPPAQRNWSTQMTNSVRSGPTLVDNLTPTGPPVERVTTRIDPVTGMLQRVTSRTQSFSDITKNVYMTETDENIENDEATEYHIKRHTIRKHRPTTPREARSATRVERTVEPIHQSQAFHSKSMDEDVAQWSGRYSHSVDGDRSQARMELEQAKSAVPQTDLRDQLDSVDNLLTELKTTPISSQPFQPEARPYRAVSQTNISGRQPMARNQWISESNLRTTTTYKQPPMYSTYSAHRENMRKMEELRRNNEDWTSNRQLEESKSAAGTEVLEEMETITLQPIGRGVHDLEPTGSIARSYRANTPTGRMTAPNSPLTTRAHSSVARIFPYSPVSRRHFRSDQQQTYYDRAAAGLDVNVAQASPVLSSIPNRSRLGSISSDHETRPSQRFSFQRIQDRTGSVTNAHSTRPTPTTLLPVRGRPLSPGSVYSHAHASRTSVPPNRDLFSPASDSRMIYKESPITSRYASLAFTPGPDQSDGYRTIATTNLHREVHTSGVPSPYAGTHHNTFYEGTNRGMDARYRVVTNQSETQWRGTDSLNAAYPGSFAHAGSISGVSGHGDLVDSEQGLLRQVKETFMDWYLPEKTREEVNALLRDKEPGSFIIRNSISYVNSFSIGLKIPQNSPHVPTRPDDIKSGFVRHFIIGTVPMHDGRGDGLQLCGFVNQPVFPSLVAFVHHHILQPGPFPCPLRLPGSIGQSNIVPVQQARMNYAPTGSQISGVAGSTGLASASAGAAGAGGDGIAADMLYLGQVEVDRLESAAAARRAVTQILTQASQGVAALPKRCEVFIKAIPHDGITFVDKTKRTMLRKHVKPSQLLWCGIDPENRTFTDPELRARGLPSARLFCIVARRQHFFMHENVVYVFSELEPSQSAINLCHYINGVFHSH